MRITLHDPARLHAPIAAEIEAAIRRVVASGRFIGGPEVAAFEEEWARACGSAHAVGVGSGTDALALGLRAAGVGPGDEVVTTAMTFVATASAIVEAGARPVIADADPETGLLDLEATAAAIGPRTAAIAPVHLWGQPVDLAAFRALADAHGLLLVEDACQAHLATSGGLRAGSVGDIAAFSFYPGKNLGAIGDAGALTTSDAAIAARVARLRDHGRGDRYVHVEHGRTARLDALQAAVLRAKLPHLEPWTARRRELAALYDAVLADVPGVVPARRGEPAGHVFHQYVVLADDRDGLAAALAADGIETAVHYPVPLGRQPSLVGVARCAGACPGAEALAARALSLPVGPELEREDVLAVATAAIAAARAGAPAP